MSEDDMYDEDAQEQEEEGEDIQSGEEEDEPPIEDSDEELDFQQPSKQEKHIAYEVLPHDVLIADYSKLVNSVMEVLGLPSPIIASCLLKYFKWNQNKLIEDYSSNPEKVMEEAGIPNLELESTPPASLTQFSCAVCLERKPVADTFALGCGHRYCKECWREFLQLKLREGAACVLARCMWPKCKSAVHEDVFRNLLSTHEYNTYRKFLLKSFVDDNPRIKWCPAPGCENCIRCDIRKETVCCTCGFSYCFNCNDFNTGDHMPASCEQIERWLQKASDESENVNWMLANTKKCPECRSPIEKNGGCMHMTCRKESGGCGYEFCWLCRGNWKDHGSHTGGYYDCNKYDKSSAKNEDMKAQDIKTELEQYMFFYHRYEAHRNAGRIANEQRKNSDKKARQILEKYEVRTTDTKFLGDATEQLIANRRVLQWSYVMGYYNVVDRVKPAERNLFEYLQEDLEKHTNHLSELYEESLEKIPDYQDFIRWKEEVTNYTRVTKKFLDNFVEGVAGGLTAH
jgi:ariadne-1